MSVEKTLKTELSRVGLSFSQDVLTKLSLYIHDLLHWNAKINLTSLQGEQLVRRLIVEPAWIAQELQLSGSFADIGSGNGSPAIPIFITRAISRADLIEARTKRAAFLRHIATRLQLQGISVHRSRVEDLEPMAEPVEWLTLQAVNPTPELMKALQRLFPATTRVVWITSGSTAPTSQAKCISVPGSNSQAWVFRLDQF